MVTIPEAPQQAIITLNSLQIIPKRLAEVTHGWPMDRPWSNNGPRIDPPNLTLGVNLEINLDPRSSYLY
jgi:hypothetical protein